MGTLRWVGVPEGEVRLVEGTYEDTKSLVLCEPGVSGESKVSVQLKEVKVSSYIPQYPILRTAQSALHFTSLAILFNQTPSLGNMQPYASNNARRLLAQVSITCL